MDTWIQPRPQIISTVISQKTMIIQLLRFPHALWNTEFHTLKAYIKEDILRILEIGLVAGKTSELLAEDDDDDEWKM